MIKIPRSWWHKGYMQALIDFEEQLENSMDVEKQTLRHFSASLRLNHFETERARKYAVRKCSQGYDEGWGQAYRIYLLGKALANETGAKD